MRVCGILLLFIAMLAACGGAALQSSPAPAPTPSAPSSAPPEPSASAPTDPPTGSKACAVSTASMKSDQLRGRVDAVLAVYDEAVDKGVRDTTSVRRACDEVKEVIRLDERGAAPMAQAKLVMLELWAGQLRDEIGKAASRKQAAAQDADERDRKRAISSAIKAASNRCGESEPGPVPSECVQACRANEASYECVVIAALYNDGKKVPADKTKASSMAEAACKGGNPAACALIDIIRKQHDSAEAKRKAEANLPALFARCEANRAQVERWRVAGIAASRAGNQGAADEAAAKMREIEPKWSQTLDELQEAIRLVTDNQGPRYEQLIGDVRRRCSCEPTRSGHCRK